MNQEYKNISSSEVVLLVHGLGGTQYDFGILKARMADAGIATVDFLLPGHGGNPQDLCGVSAEDWVQSVRQKIVALRQQHRIVHVMGMCMGALLAAEAAKAEALGSNGLDRLVLLAPPLFLDGWSLPWYRALRYAVYCVPMVARYIRFKEQSPFGVKNLRLRNLLRKKFSRGDSFHYGCAIVTIE